jgi:multifunctional beta-oxidation protein
MPSILSFSDQVVLVLGTSNVISKSYAWFFESRGAKVVLGDVRGCGGNVSHLEFHYRSNTDADVQRALKTKVKDTKHHRIVAKSPAQLAVSAVEHTVKAHGRLDVLLISSIAASSSKSDGTDDSAWNILIDGHLQSAFKSVRAAWPYFRKQRFGRILFTADTHGGSDQFLDSATNFALLGLAKTIGIEGLKHNVLCNVIAPLQGDFLPDVDPDMVLTIAAVLVHSANSAETGSLFAVDGKRVSRMRWQRSAGAVLKPTPTMTAGTVLSRWHHYVDFSRAVWPSQGIDFDLILQTAIRMEDNELVKSPDFSGKVVIVTGAGAG